MKSFQPAKQRGQVFVVIAISLVMLVAVVGLAIESGLGYLIKAKLNSAVDAAAVAGARAASKGGTQGEQRAAVTEAARASRLDTEMFRIPPAGYHRTDKNVYFATAGAR